MIIDRSALLDKAGNWYGHALNVVGAENLSLGEWNECIRFSTIANKWPEQIGRIHKESKASAERLALEISQRTEYPSYYELKYKDIGLSDGEAKDRAALDMARCVRRLNKARLNIELCEAEMAIRKDMALPDTPAKYRGAGVPLSEGKYTFDLRGQNIERAPIGTTYYIDADTGNNADDGLSTANAWLTYAQFMETTTRSAGDIAIVRRNTTGTYHASDAAIGFDESGTVASPIILQGDYTNAFGDDVNISATATATLTFGSKTVTFSADVSGVIAAGTWLLASGDSFLEHGMHVASVVTTTVTLSLPYNGNQAGSGKTITNIGLSPVYGTTAQANSQFDLDTLFVYLIGHHHKTNDSTGVYSLASGFFQMDCCEITAGSTRRAFIGSGGNGKLNNFILHAGNEFLVAGSSACKITVNRAKFTCTDGISYSTSSAPLVVDFNEVDLSGVTTNIVERNGNITNDFIRMRNCKIPAVTLYDPNSFADAQFLLFEDYNNTPGDTRQYTGLDNTVDDIVIQSDTGTTRSGGSATSIKVTPVTNLNVNHEFSRLRIFEQVHYLPASATTLTVYLKPDSTAEWTADPTAAQLWLEVEAWGHASNNFRKITKSTDTIDMNGTSGWQALSVSVTPAQADRSARVRLWYAKPKESGKTNIFYVDPLIVRSIAGSDGANKPQGVMGEFTIVDTGAASGGNANLLAGKL